MNDMLYIFAWIFCLFCRSSHTHFYYCISWVEPYTWAWASLDLEGVDRNTNGDVLPFLVLREPQLESIRFIYLFIVSYLPLGIRSYHVWECIYRLRSFKH